MTARPPRSSFLSPNAPGPWVWRRSPLVWAGAYLALALWAFRGVPVVWAWDSFTYLDAAMSRKSFVILGLGRSFFLWLGWGFAWLSERAGADPLWGAFRLWALAGVFLYTAILAWGAWILPRRLGMAGAHVLLACAALHSQLHQIHLGVWPETWSLLCFSAAALLLAGSREGRLSRLRLPLAAAFAIAMTLFKEVYILYLPALAILVFFVERTGDSWRRALLKAALFFCVAAGAAGILNAILPALLPGLREMRAEVVQQHFGQPGVGLSHLRTNLIEFVKAILHGPAQVALASLGVWRFAAEWAYRRRRGGALVTPAFLFASALFGAPAVFVVLTGAPHNMGRYDYMMLPGLWIFAALAFWPAAPPLFRARWIHWALALAALAAVCLFNGWHGYVYFIRSQEECRARYEGFQRLLAEPLGIVAADDAWPAHFIRLYAPRAAADAPPANWEIFWPGWDVKSGGAAPADWIAAQNAAGRRLAISESCASRAGVPLQDLLRQTGLEFEKDAASGWWISRAPAAPPSAP